MILAYLTHDQVNEPRARELADARGVQLSPLFLKEAATAGPFDAIVHDLDCLPSAARRAILKNLLAGPLTCAAAVHGYRLEEAEGEALRGRGVVAHPHLEEVVRAVLARAVGRGAVRGEDAHAEATSLLDRCTLELGEL